MRFKLNFNKMMVILLLILTFFTAIYFYIYKSHRNISKENAAFTVNAAHIINEFSEDFEVANQKYADQTIEISGYISDLNLDQKVLMLNESITFLGIDNFESLEANQKITIKGRLVGYDELIEEIIVDQSIVSNKEGL
jgi:hypothetical protein